MELNTEEIMRDLLCVFAMRSTRHLVLSSIMFACFMVTGCMHWTPPPTTNSDFLKQLEASPRRVRMTLLTGERVTFRNGLVQGDSVKDTKGSILRRMYEPGFSSLRSGGRTISMLEIQKIEVWTIDPAGTIILGILVIVPFAIFAAQGGALGTF